MFKLSITVKMLFTKITNFVHRNPKNIMTKSFRNFCRKLVPEFIKIQFLCDEITFIKSLTYQLMYLVIEFDCFCATFKLSSTITLRRAIGAVMERLKRGSWESAVSEGSLPLRKLHQRLLSRLKQLSSLVSL